MQTYHFDSDIKIINLGDIHRGSKNCDEKTLYRNIARIKEDPECYWVSTGDILDAATKTSKSSVYESIPLKEELALIEEELTPISHKCLGFVSSNHHNRVKREIGLSLDDVVANTLRIPFLGVNSNIKVVCGRAAYFVNLFHGVGGGTPGNKVNRALRMAHATYGCDVYMSGHTHTKWHFPMYHKVLDRKRDKSTRIKVHFVVTGHYIQYDKSYAEDMGLEEMPIGSSMITLAHLATGNQENKKITVDFCD